MWSTQATRNNFFCLSVWQTHTHTHEYLHIHTQHEDIPLQYCLQHPDLWRLQSCNDWHYISWVPHLRFGSPVCACVVCVCVYVCLKRWQQEGSHNVIYCHAGDVRASAPLHLCTQHFPWSLVFCCIWQQHFSCCYRVKYSRKTMLLTHKRWCIHQVNVNDWIRDVYSSLCYLIRISKEMPDMFKINIPVTQYVYHKALQLLFATHESRSDQSTSQPSRQVTVFRVCVSDWSHWELWSDM